MAARLQSSRLPASVGRFFRYSPWDAIPIAFAVVNLAAIVAVCIGYRHLSLGVLIGASLALAVAQCWNLQCSAHNFIHNPYFKSDSLNRTFSVLVSLCIGVPQLLNHWYHISHHVGDNDRIGPDGDTKDWSSIYRYGNNDEPEGIVKYSLVSHFRSEIGRPLSFVRRGGWANIVQVGCETAAIATMWILFALYDYRFFFCFYLPTHYVGWVITYAEGYLEHYGCTPGNNYANSVSSYSRLYNLLTLNNGYHQEHHWDPKAHWTKMQQVHETIKTKLAANGTRIIRGPHITALFEDWWNACFSAKRLGHEHSSSSSGEVSYRSRTLKGASREMQSGNAASG